MDAISEFIDKKKEEFLKHGPEGLPGRESQGLSPALLPFPESDHQQRWIS